jgi:dTDP-glucose 4,6-dehydratase
MDMDMKNILVTGGAGFIGSNFLTYFIESHPDCRVINLDLLTYAGDIDNFNELLPNQRFKFIEGDICDRNHLTNIFSEYNITDVFHFAAESHVDNSISDPECFIRTNVLGTFNLLDVARNYWMDAPNKFKEEYRDSRFLHVSTDEVYGSLGETGLFTEETPYAPNSPYSASKASSDLIVRSYHHTYGMNVVTTNCSNNYGPKQHVEKLIPTIIRKALSGEDIPIYGDGKNVRDWLYVLDHCKGIDLAFHKGISGEMYNIGGNNEKTNIDIAYEICAVLDELKPRTEGPYRELIKFVSDRPGHDFRYAIDATKSRTHLGWKADEVFSTGIEKTIRWYLEAFDS